MVLEDISFLCQEGITFVLPKVLMVNEPPPIPYTAASLFLKFLKSQKMLITEIMPWHPLTTAVQCNITGYLCPLKYSACSLSLAQKTPLLTPILRYTVRCRLHNIAQLLNKFHSQVWMWRLERQYHHSKTGIIFRYRQLASAFIWANVIFTLVSLWRTGYGCHATMQKDTKPKHTAALYLW